MNITKPNNLILSSGDEIKAWFSSNINDSIILLEHCNDTNIITVLVKVKHLIHILKIKYPTFYPNERLGFEVKEIERRNVTPLKIISWANEQCRCKKLSISKVLNYLAKHFTNNSLHNIKEINKMSQPNINNSRIEQTTTETSQNTQPNINHLHDENIKTETPLNNNLISSPSSADSLVPVKKEYPEILTQTLENEIRQWFFDNKIHNIKLISHIGNYITISVQNRHEIMTSFTHAVCENEPRLWGTHNSRTSFYTPHFLLIRYPALYPHNGIGFRVHEIHNNLFCLPEKIIDEANAQYFLKPLSIYVVLDYLSKPFKYVKMDYICDYTKSIKLCDLYAVTMRELEKFWNFRSTNYEIYWKQVFDYFHEDNHYFDGFDGESELDSDEVCIPGYNSSFTDYYRDTRLDYDSVLGQVEIYTSNIGSLIKLCITLTNFIKENRIVLRKGALPILKSILSEHSIDELQELCKNTSLAGQETDKIKTQNTIIEQLVIENQKQLEQINKLSEEVAFLRRKEELIPSEYKCRMCFGFTDKKKILIPCGHTQYCNICITELTKCSLCGSNVNSVIEIHN